MTGMHSGQCSVRSNSGGVPLPSSDVTIAEMLKALGYQTGGFGKWALGTIGSPGDPQKQGFDEFFGYYHQTHAHSHYAEYLVDNGKQVRIENNIGIDWGYETEGIMPPNHPETGKPLVYAPYRLMDRAKDFIRRNSERPFFCYLPLTVPHGHFHIPANDPIAARLKGSKWSDRALAVSAMTQLLDRQMGELVALLKDLNLDQKTLVIFCSDHGAALRFEGELDASGPYLGKKRTVYEGGLRIPLIARWPGKIKAGSETDHVTYLGDLFATFREIACTNIADQKKVELLLDNQRQTSISFVPTLLGRSGQRQHPFLLWEFAPYNPRSDQWGQRMQAIRTGQWKLLRQSDSQPWELYHLGHDPYENTDLVSRYPDRAEQMAALFAKNRTNPPPQEEAMLDWMLPFTWENRDRDQRTPTPAVEDVVAQSESRFRNVRFEQDAIMLGLTANRNSRGLVQLNIAWQLNKDRRANRFIHLCDADGKTLRQLRANQSKFQSTDRAARFVESIVMTPEVIGGAEFVAMGFFEKGRGMAPIVDHPSGKRLGRLEVFRFR